MAEAPKQIPLLVIAGPTATGKTETAIRVARSVGGEIVSADSMQIYRRLDVGTAKPTLAERAAVRFHVVDVVDLDEPYTVADFQRDARAAIAATFGRGNLPILCGGTGLYVRAVLEHFVFPQAEAADQARVRGELEEELAEFGSEELHRRLGDVDPGAAARISPADAKRIVRALEVLALSGRPISEEQRVDEHPAVAYNTRYFVLNRPRAELYAAIDARVERMMSAGWLDEVRWIDAQGYGPALQSLQAIGYRRLLEWLRAERGANGPKGAPTGQDEVVERIKRDTRRFAKRQLTWFRREAEARWVQWSGRSELEALTRVLCREARQLCDGGGLRPMLWAQSRCKKP